MTIRQLTSRDLPAFLATRAAGLAADPDSFRVTPEDDTAMGEAAWAERLDRDVVVAFEADGAMLGIGGLQRFTGAKLAHKALIWGMFVRPEARGRGVADAIVTDLIERAPADVTQLLLTVMAHNQRARRLYERHGFSLYAVEPAAIRIGEAFLDEALMWRRLG